MEIPGITPVRNSFFLIAFTISTVQKTKVTKSAASKDPASYIKKYSLYNLREAE